MTKNRGKIFLLSALALFWAWTPGGGVEGALKIWTHSVNLGLAEQWMDEKLPCPGQRVVLPQQVCTWDIEKREKSGLGKF